MKMSPARLRSQCLPDNAKTFYVQVTVDGVLAGNVFACRWDYEGRQVCWITQLVVHGDYREQHIATTLLSALMDPDDDAYGIMSSHPAACKALAKAIGGTWHCDIFGTGLTNHEDFRFADVSLDFAQAHAAGVMAASPVEYIKAAKLRGSLFDSSDTSGLVSGVDTGFYVDHEEPLQALTWMMEHGSWPLGDLPEGHEFLFLVEMSGRRRSRSASCKPKE